MRDVKSLGVIALLALAGAVGCGDGDGNECGEGTVEMDGVCVPENTAICGDGTVNLEGRCVPAATACADGTTYDAATRRCQANSAECGTGTRAMGNQCVPDGSVICHDGTEFNAETGRCEVTGEACGTGAVLLDGRCVPADAALMADVNEMEPNDPAYEGGAANSITLPTTVGERRTLRGCINPSNLDTSTPGLEPDLDWFQFAVTAPGYYRINADGLGGLAAGFVIQATEGAAAQRFLRAGINLVNDTSERRIYLPAAGTYQLAVVDSRSLDLSSLDIGEGVGIARVVGGPQSCYFVTIETLAIPTAQPLTDLVAAGEFTEPRFYSVPSTEGASYFMQVREEVAGAVPALLGIVGNTFTVGGGIAFSPKVPAGGTMTVVVDYVYNISLDPARWDLELTEWGDAPAEGDVTFTHDDDPQSFGSFATFDATAGDVVRLAVSSATTIRAGVYGPDLTGAQVCANCTEAELYYVVQTTGTQYIQIISTDETVADGATFTVSFDRSSQTPPTIALDTPTEVSLVEERTFVWVDASSLPWAVFEFTNFMGSSFTAVDTIFYPEDIVVLDDLESVDSEFDTTGFARIYGPSLGDRVLVEVNNSAAFTAGDRVTFEVSPRPFTELMGTIGTPVTRTGDTVPAGGRAYYLVRAGALSSVTFQAQGAAGDDLTVVQLDREEGVVQTVNATGAGGAESARALVSDTGWVAFAVQAGAAASTINVTVTTAPPPYVQSVGTTTFTSVCPPAGAGTQLINGDDLLTPVRPFTTFTGFTYFGAAVASMRVNTNGWLSFNPSTTETTAYNPLGVPGPGAVIAPHAQDLDTRVCISETANRVVIEWVGETFAFLTPPTPVQFQVILDATTDTIEFVYGPNHQSTAAAVSGIENADESITIRTTLGREPGNAVLFTPSP